MSGLSGSRRVSLANVQQAAEWEPVLPSGVAFEEIVAPTPTDLTRAAQLAYITRNTWEPGSASGGFCYDLETGGPQIVVVEDGTISASIYGSNQQTIDMLQISGMPTAFLAAKNHSPAAMTPESRVDLEPGDAIVVPYGWECGRSVFESASGPSQFLEIQIFPSGYQQPTNYPDMGYIGQRLDISFGMVTVNEPVPTFIVAGRLRVGAGALLTLEDIGMPLALHVEAGDATLNAVHDSGLLRGSSTDGTGSSLPLPSGENVPLVPDQQVYVPATATGTLTSATAADFLMVAVDFGVIRGE